MTRSSPPESASGEGDAADASRGGDVFDRIRSACAHVADVARAVRIDHAQLEHYRSELPRAEIQRPPALALPGNARTGEARAAFVLTLDAVNFGSGYFPFLAKLEGRSGYGTIEARLHAWFESAGVPTQERLRALDPESCAHIFGQTLDVPERAELMVLFARALRDLGAFASEGFEPVVRAAGGSAARLVDSLCSMPLYRDVSRYEGTQVPFLKRAQITVQDLAGSGAARFRDLDRLTLFADNLVPHVLRLDGVLRFDPDLVRRIEAQELIEHGSPEEVEMRACALHAVELLSSAGLPPRLIDTWLWWRGSRPEYKARPRARSRCPYY